jgi:hypothetical protein
MGVSSINSNSSSRERKKQRRQQGNQTEQISRLKETIWLKENLDKERADRTPLSRSNESRWWLTHAFRSDSRTRNQRSFLRSFNSVSLAGDHSRLANIYLTLANSTSQCSSWPTRSSSSDHGWVPAKPSSSSRGVECLQTKKIRNKKQLIIFGLVSWVCSLCRGTRSPTRS